MDILCKIANSERDLIRVVVDVVSELREGQGDEEIDAVSITHSPRRWILTVSLHQVICRSLEVLFVAEPWWPVL